MGTVEVDADISAACLSGGRPGFCFRVLEEGGVAASDELVEIAAAPERMIVFDVNSLLCVLGHPRSKVQRAHRLAHRVPFEQEWSGGAMMGNPGLDSPLGPLPT